MNISKEGFRPPGDNLLKHLSSSLGKALNWMRANWISSNKITETSLEAHNLEVSILRSIVSLTGEIKGQLYLKPILIRRKIVKVAELATSNQITHLIVIGTKVLATLRKLLMSVLFKEDGELNRQLL